MKRLSFLLAALLGSARSVLALTEPGSVVCGSSCDAAVVTRRVVECGASGNAISGGLSGTGVGTR